MNEVSFADGPGFEEAILADLLRRSWQFAEVKGICHESLLKYLEEMIAKPLQFQRALADKAENGRFSEADIEP
jgi:hypothetical protein